jgi:hypothetical protein
MENFKKTFSSNCYPKAIIDSCIKTFLDRIYITPKRRSINVPRKLFTSAFLSRDIMVYRPVQNIVKFLLLLIHKFPYVLFSVPLVAFLVSFHLKTGFPLRWDHMLCISSRVNAVAQRMLAKYADTFTHVSQSIWESRLWQEKLLYLHNVWYTRSQPHAQNPLLISKSYYQALLSGIFLSVKAY